MSRYKDMKGQKYGSLTVVSFSHMDKHNSANWKCICECGAFKTVSRPHLTSGDIKSCGCLKREINHKQSSSKLYYVWVAMIDRCRNPNNKSYKYYGARGIKVCEDWSDFREFHLWAEESGYSEDLTIERKDVDGDYHPSNCEWIPFSDQAKNKRYKLPRSGVRNVTWHEASKKWYVRVFKNGELFYRKLFSNFNEACSVAKKMNEKSQEEK